jgi:hypothetical protein
MPDTTAVEARRGDKTIEVTVRFWTDDITEDPGKILPKHAWTSGMVRMKENESHGIKAGKWVPFNSLFGIGPAIEEVLAKQEIVLHPSKEMDKYLAPRPLHTKPKSRWTKPLN